MKRLLTLFTFLTILVTASVAQNRQTRSTSFNTVADARVLVDLNFAPPRYNDTTQANLSGNKGLDSIGNIIYTRNTKSYWGRTYNPVGTKKWFPIGSVDTATISSIIHDSLIASGSQVRFGIEDDLGLQDRSVDMQGHDFFLTNAKVTIIGSDSIGLGGAGFQSDATDVTELGAVKPTILAKMFARNDNLTQFTWLYVEPDRLYTKSFTLGDHYLPLVINGRDADSLGRITIPIDTGFITNLVHDSLNFVTPTDTIGLQFPLYAINADSLAIAPFIRGTINTDSIYYSLGAVKLFAFMDSSGSAGGGGSVYTVNNGLTENVAGNFQLGGSLIQNTTINATGIYSLTLTGAGGNGSGFVPLKTVNTNGGTSLSSTSSTGIGIDAYTTSGVAINATSLSAGTAIAGLSSTGNAFYGETSNAVSGVFRENLNNAGLNNTVRQIVSVERGQSIGGVANGIGASIDYNIQTSSGIFRTANRLVSKWTDAMDGTRTSQFIIAGVDNTVTADLFTISGSGATKLNKYGIGAFTGTATYALQVDASGNVIEGAVGAASSAWLLLGNAGTNPATNFLGTTDSIDLKFRVNNTNYGFLGANVLTVASTAYGYHTLNSLTSGTFNTAVGADALQSNTTGSQNTAIGHSAFAGNLIGNSSVAIGNRALEISNITAGGTLTNIAIGASAMRLTTTGYSNVAIGSSVMLNNITGIENTVVGTSGLLTNTAGSQNTVVGRAAAQFITGSGNTVMGAYTGSSVGSGNYNTILGAYIVGAVVSNSLYIGDGQGNLFITANSARKLAFPAYGAGTQTGTATYTLQVDAAGNVIEGAVGGGGGGTPDSAFNKYDLKATADRLHNWINFNFQMDSVDNFKLHANKLILKGADGTGYWGFNPFLAINYTTLANSNLGGVLEQYNNGYSLAVDGNDATGGDFRIKRSGSNIIVERRPYVVGPDTTILDWNTSTISVTSGSRRLYFNRGVSGAAQERMNDDILVIDNYTSTRTTISNADTSSFAFVIDANAASRTNRFSVVINPRPDNSTKIEKFIFHPDMLDTSLTATQILVQHLDTAKWVQPNELPVATITSRGGYRAVTTTYTARIKDYIINCDATAGAFTVTLPSAVAQEGKSFIVRKSDVSGNAVTVLASINGAASYSLPSQYNSVTLSSDGVGYMITASH